MHATSFLPAQILVATSLVAMSGAVPQVRPSLTVEPSRVDVRMLYRQSIVHVAASVPVGAQVAVLLVGRDHSLTLKRKGKVMGAVWMNVGDVTFENVPVVYLLNTSTALAELAEQSVRTRLDLGFDALDRRAGGGPAADSLFGELVKLKERDGLWSVSEDGVTVTTAATGDGAVAVADFVLPAEVPTGEYDVRAYTFVDGEVRLAGEGSLRVAQAGGAALITKLARHHGLLYGILAVLIAAAAGLLTGFVFGRGAGKGH